MNTKYIEALENYIKALEACPVWSADVRKSPQGLEASRAQAIVALAKYPEKK